MDRLSCTSMNKVYLYGRILSTPKFSHRTFGDEFYTFDLEVKRLSGSVDILPITISKANITNIDRNMLVGVAGQLRSYNIVRNGTSRLVLTVFVKSLSFDYEERSTNEIYLEGYICKPPIYRVTPFKREISDMLLAVNRAYGKSDYIPLIAWGKNAVFAKELKVGKKLKVNGRIQSREYEKIVESGESNRRTAYEVSVSRLETADASD
jgi:single-stranded DNA-binding protein